MSIRRVLLVDVEFDRSHDAGGAQLQTRWTHHPLGLMYLSAALKAAFDDIEVKVVHTVTLQHSVSSLDDIMTEFQPDLVGLRALSLFQKQFQEVAHGLRSHSQPAILVGGGPYASASYRELLTEGVVDIAVLKEGEETLVELVASLRENRSLPTTLLGTAVLGEGGVVVNEPRALAELDSLPYPDYDAIRLDDYEGFSNIAFQSTAQCAFIKTSRGCPYQCYYCHAAETRVRRRTVDHVVEEVRIRYESGIRNFIFVDDIFNVPRKPAKQILRRIAREFPEVALNFPNGLRADQLDDEFLDLLEACGTRHLALAIETATPRIQAMVGKYMKIEKARAMVHEASKRFITCGFFMVGFPTETMDEALDTIAFAEELTFMAQPVLSIVRVYPETPLFSALDATEEQARRLEQQTSEALQPHLNGDPSFYGDFFSTEQVPLSSEDITALRWQWVKRVHLNPERLLNGNEIIRRHLEPERVLQFYQGLFDNPKFSQRSLDGMLAKARAKRGGSSKAAQGGEAAAS